VSVRLPPHTAALITTAHNRSYPDLLKLEIATGSGATRLCRPADIGDAFERTDKDTLRLLVFTGAPAQLEVDTCEGVA
jgi:hypothetical protein